MSWSRAGGHDSGPLLVLLHGLGATSEVYAGAEHVLAERWPGGWLVVDLRGHGRSDWDPPYSFDRHADAVRALLPAERDVVVLGHSMGGIVTLELADLRALVRDPVTLPGLGHNAHVEGPAAVVDLVLPFA